MITNSQLRFVEFETAADLKKAVEALDGREFKEHRVTCTPNVGLLQLVFFFLVSRLIMYRLNPTSPARVEIALVLQVADPIPLAMIGTAEALPPVVSVPVGMATATDTAREAHVAITMRIAPDTDRLLGAVLLRSTRYLRVAMMTHTAENTLLPILT